MAKKNKLPEKEELQNYYELNLDAVDRLVNATKETAPDIPEEEEVFTKQGFLARVPSPVKALVVKYWFFGAACFFFYWGLGMFVSDPYALILILGVAIGMLTDLLVNNLFRYFQSSEKEYNKWMLLPMKKFWTFFVNLAYGLILVLLVRSTYDLINKAAIKIYDLPKEHVALGVEPFLFGVFCLIYDLCFIWTKNLIVYLVKRHKVRY